MHIRVFPNRDRRPPPPPSPPPWTPPPTHSFALSTLTAFSLFCATFFFFLRLRSEQSSCSSPAPSSSFTAWSEEECAASCGPYCEDVANLTG